MLYKVIFLLLLCFFSLSTFAQDNSFDKGFKLTDNTVLNISLSLMPEFDSNVVDSSEKNITTITDSSGNSVVKKNKPASDVIFHVMPALKLKINDNFKTLGMSFMMDYNRYSGIESEDEVNKNIINLSSEVLGEINKNSIVTFVIKNKLKKDTNYNNPALSGQFSNLLEDISLGLYVKNYEETLMLKIGGGLSFNYFEKETMHRYNFLSFRGNIYGKWNFLPKTAFFINSSILYQDYLSSGALREDQKSMPINAFMGIIGQITSKISLKLSAGYVHTMSKDNTMDFTTGVETVFRLNRKSMIKLGYARAYFPVATFQYYRNDRISLNVNQKIGRRILLSLNSHFSMIAFGNSIEKGGIDTQSSTMYDITRQYSSTNRDDMDILIEPSVSFNILKWLGMKLSYSFEKKITDYSSTVTFNAKSGVTPQPDNTKIQYDTYYDYDSHRIFLMLIADY